MSHASTTLLGALLGSLKAALSIAGKEREAETNFGYFEVRTVSTGAEKTLDPQWKAQSKNVVETNWVP